MIKMIRTVILVFAICILASTITFGQTNDVRLEQLRSVLSLQPEKCKIVIEALDYKKDLIVQNLKDKNLKPAERRKILEVVVKERQEKLNALLTPQQIIKLRNYQSLDVKRYYESTQIKQAKNIEEGKKKIRGGKFKRRTKNIPKAHNHVK